VSLPEPPAITFLAALPEIRSEKELPMAFSMVTLNAIATFSVARAIPVQPMELKLPASRSTMAPTS
jgi:hypothetical protein